MSKQQEIREQVTAKIVAALEKDILPWRRPWVTSGPGRHTNVVSKKAIQRRQSLALEIHAAAHGFRSHWWGTFNQWHHSAAWSSVGPMALSRASGVAAS